ncbi:MAG: DUF1549 and DUF1553 domain-containing protein [Pirellulales bacterium]
METISPCAWRPLGFAPSAILLCFLAVGDGRAEQPITAEDRAHWAFAPRTNPAIPAVRSADLARGAIDRFILAELEKADLSTTPPADRTTLIRRVTFDLTGMPPMPDEVDAFLADDSPDAYERLVDRLLTSPAFGERFALFWLDLARFAETDGFEHDLVRPDAWKYRDWVIKAASADLPYDRFLALQLAGDELAAGDADAATATGFCLAGPDMPDINSQLERRHNVLNEMTGTVASVFLALQLGCAQCHDHKYDPISQEDFYRMRAVFEPAVRFERNKSQRAMSKNASSGSSSFLMVRGDYRRQGAEVQPAFPRIVSASNESTGHQAAGRRSALAAWLTRPDNPLTARVIVNRLWQQHFNVGLSSTPSDFGVMGEAPSHPELLDYLAGELTRTGWSLKRVHRAMVTSATYRQASRLSTPGWSDEQRKRTAAAWRKAASQDSQNRLLSRMPRRRLEGEAIRDAMLLAADSRSTRRGGPGVMPPLPAELVKTLLKDHWKTSVDSEDHYRASIYLFVRRNLRYPVFEAFDRPDANVSCPSRHRSTTALQSLLLINSAPALQCAQRLAGRATAEAGGDATRRMTICFRRALGRPPTEEESRQAADFLARQTARLRSDARPASALALPHPPSAGDADPHAAAAMVDLCLAIYNLSEFVYVD